MLKDKWSQGAAAHASGAMRSDTRAATRLVHDWLLAVFENSYSADFESAPGEVFFKSREISSSGDQFKNRLDVGLLGKVKKGSDRRSWVWGQGHGQPKTVSYDQLIAELFSFRFPLLGSWIIAGGQLANAECLDDIAKLWIVRFSIRYILADSICVTHNARHIWGEPLALDFLGWDSEGLYLLVGDCNSLSNARLLTPHSLLFSGDQYKSIGSIIGTVGSCQTDQEREVSIILGNLTIQVRSGMIQVMSGLAFGVKSGTIQVKSGLIQVKFGSVVNFGLSRWLGRTHTGLVRSVFRTWTWLKLHSGCKWVEAVHGSIVLGGTARKANLG
ncbi:hypothetical protein F2Q70_00011154 [Brassica cretica]|nr:hypothetical protein F2Q70_00011154 [Brassica cretica]